ncbi:MAG: prolipoprotein diacylglyceryl transferase [Archangium sp.]|nr:prolipoprotein diacylglyceryl transferase [Archangium sp.]MDP3151787.1 prolipoprotein diacylglyceryl transferase [Archangium sp.]MDP3573305.1 prolipoprotein diacylglyceryl transferase [Archangium sp.]
MIPYFELPALNLPFGQRVDIFGVLSAAGVMVGAWLAARQARQYSPGNDQPLREMVPWAVLFGLYGGHFMHLFAYHPELLTMADPLLVLRFWEGLSSMGGVLGALVGIFIFFRRIKTPIGPYLDALALGTAPGWMVARIGCFFVHDHPGVHSDFFLAVNFPMRTYGGPRHDLGLYDALVLGVLSLVLYALKTRRPAQGRLMGVLAVGYTVPRFFLDFLRASDLSFVDRRYAGLTPAQYVVVGLFAAGVWLLTRPAPPMPKEVG